MIDTKPTENTACTAPVLLLLPCCKLLIPGSAFNSESLTYLGVSCFWTIAQGFSAVSLAEITNSQSSGTERRKRYLQDVRRRGLLGIDWEFKYLETLSMRSRHRAR